MTLSLDEALRSLGFSFSTLSFLDADTFDLETELELPSVSLAPLFDDEPEVFLVDFTGLLTGFAGVLFLLGVTFSAPLTAELCFADFFDIFLGGVCSFGSSSSSSDLLSS